MHTETLSVGSELVTGITADTNIAWLAGRLARLGLSIRRHTILPDHLDDLAAHVRRLRQEARQRTLLLVTGGLGPTLDDLTRQAVAAAMDAPLAESAECRKAIEEMFNRHGWTMAQSNLRQALIPQGGTPLPNSCGTAPGFYLPRNHLHVFALPGVPSEMKAMYTEQVEPMLRKLAPGERVVCRRTLHTFGLGESAVGQLIAEHMAPGRKVQVGTTAASGLVSIRLRAAASCEAEAHRMLDQEGATLCGKLGQVYVGRDNERLPEVVARLLSEAGATLAVAESCTGGLIAMMMTDMPGASKFFIEGVVAYANQSKVIRLGVPAELIDRPPKHGAVSEPVARAMAEGLRRSRQVTFALATTGIAGPTGGTPDKPVGLVYVALAGPGRTEVLRLNLVGDRSRIRRRASLAAINLLRLRLSGIEPKG